MTITDSSLREEMQIMHEAINQATTPMTQSLRESVRVEGVKKAKLDEKITGLTDTVLKSMQVKVKRCEEGLHASAKSIVKVARGMRERLGPQLEKGAKILDKIGWLTQTKPQISTYFETGPKHISNFISHSQIS